MVSELLRTLASTHAGTQPLRQLYPHPNSGASGDDAKVEYATRHSTVTMLTVFSIIAIHGLNPRSKKDADHAWDTWRTPAGPQGRLWLRDDLPQYVPESRIFLYEYNSTAVYGKDRSTFIDKANELLEAIRTKKDDVESRPILLLGHSMGGLLIKQALINAHNNPKYTPIKDATMGLAFFATPHHGGDWMLVSLGRVAAKIATAVGFQKGDDVVETLKDGSIFSDIMQGHWRHQLLKYDIISFWGALDSVGLRICIDLKYMLIIALQIVPRESARFGMPGDRENVVKLNADHSGVCKFGPSQTDQDNFKLVRSNIRDLYKNALKNCELTTIPSIIGREGRGTTDEDGLQVRLAKLKGDDS
jgi:hypothetical protein